MESQSGDGFAKHTSSMATIPPIQHFNTSIKSEFGCAMSKPGPPETDKFNTPTTKNVHVTVSAPNHALSNTNEICIPEIQQDTSSDPKDTIETPHSNPSVEVVHITPSPTMGIVSVQNKPEKSDTNYDHKFNLPAEKPIHKAPISWEHGNNSRPSSV